MAGLVVTALAVLGGIVAVVASRATVIRDPDGAVAEWAPPLSLWQWAIGGVIEFVLIGLAAGAWWGAWSLWAGRDFPALKLPSPRPFALGAGVAMIAATALALITHVRNWNEWHTLIAQHPEWHEGAQSWQIPVGAAVALLVVAAVVAAYGFVRRRLRPHRAEDAPRPGLRPETQGDR